MSQNIANGGLVTVYLGNVVLSDMKNRWFMNANDEGVFYSDESRGGYLCCSSAENPEGSVILKKPCKNVIVNGDWIYYINANDGRICRCLLSGKSETLVTRDAAAEFALYKKDELVYVLKSGGLKNSDGKLLNEAKAVRLCVAAGAVFYADADNGHRLTRFDLSSYREKAFDIVPSFINHDGEYVYFTNRNDENFIYRLEPQSARCEKICGESALYPHIITLEKDVYPGEPEDWLYFWQGKKWKRLPLSGGASEEA